MTIITNARFPGSARRVDIAIKGGAIAAITPAGSRISATATGSTAPIIDADGRWAIPGLWDCHTHFTQWAQTFGRLDLIGARSASEAMSMLRNHLEARRNSPEGLDPDVFVVGMRFRHSLWSRDEQPTLAAIDAASGDQPVALSSADMHCGWVNSAAARRLGLTVRESGLVDRHRLGWLIHPRHPRIARGGGRVSRTAGGCD